MVTTDLDTDEEDVTEEKVCCRNLQTIACTRGRVNKRKSNIVALASGEGLKMYEIGRGTRRDEEHRESALSSYFSQSTRAGRPSIPFTEWLVGASLGGGALFGAIRGPRPSTESAGLRH